MVKQEFEPKQCVSEASLLSTLLSCFSLLEELIWRKEMYKYSSYITCIEPVYLVSISYKRTKPETIALLVQINNLAHRRFSDSSH